MNIKLFSSEWLIFVVYIGICFEWEQTFFFCLAKGKRHRHIIFTEQKVRDCNCRGEGVELKQFKYRGQTMHEKDIRVIEKFESLVSQKAKVHEIRVFGSRARGDATEESDLDVLVVVDYLDHEIEKYISDCAWEAGFPEDIVIMPIAITLDALKNSPIRESVFIKNVYAEGVTV